MKKLKTWVTALMIGIIRMYQRYVSPWFGDTCRFVPSCSEYACQSLVAYGPLLGSWRALCRICRCHPFHPGGYDPVYKSGNEL